MQKQQKIKVSLKPGVPARPDHKIGGILFSFDGGDGILRVKDPRTKKLGTEFIPAHFAENYKRAGEIFNVDFVDAEDAPEVLPSVTKPVRSIAEVQNLYGLPEDPARVWFEAETKAAEENLAPYSTRARLPVAMDTNPERLGLILEIVSMDEPTWRKLKAARAALDQTQGDRAGRASPDAARPSGPPPGDAVSALQAELDRLASAGGAKSKGATDAIRAGLRTTGVEPSTGNRKEMIKEIMAAVAGDTRRAGAVLAAVRTREAEGAASPANGGPDAENAAAEDAA